MVAAAVVVFIVAVISLSELQGFGCKLSEGLTFGSAMNIHTNKHTGFAGSVGSAGQPVGVEWLNG